MKPISKLLKRYLDRDYSVEHKVYSRVGTNVYSSVTPRQLKVNKIPSELYSGYLEPVALDKRLEIMLHLQTK